MNVFKLFNSIITNSIIFDFGQKMTLVADPISQLITRIIDVLPRNSSIPEFFLIQEKTLKHGITWCGLIVSFPLLRRRLLPPCFRPTVLFLFLLVAVGISIFVPPHHHIVAFVLLFFLLLSSSLLSSSSFSILHLLFLFVIFRCSLEK